MRRERWGQQQKYTFERNSFIIPENKNTLYFYVSKNKYPDLIHITKKVFHITWHFIFIMLSAYMR